MPAQAEITTIIIDCADPQALAQFYRQVTGWTITSSDADSAYLGEGPIQLAFQRIEGYQGPSWPDDRKHAHLDFRVDDVERASKAFVALGAAVPEFQPGGGSWTVLTDPEGHPFCIMAG